MIAPHGDKLIERVLDDNQRGDIIERAPGLLHIRLDAGSISDVENIATGVFSPLAGFMGREDFHHVLNQMRLSNDLPWTIPIVLDVDKSEAARLKAGSQVILTNDESDPVAVLHLEEKYDYDREEMARKVFGTTDAVHPGAAKVLNMKDVLLSGKIDLIQKPPTPFARFKLTPRETRELFKEKGWRTVVGFQTCGIPHLGHEHVQKSALAFADGVFISPVVGGKKRGDYRDEVILASYEELIKTYDLKERAVMAILQMEMRHAGPREAIFHAVIRKNFGCTHIIIGRDQAGVGNYYHPFAAQDIFEEFPDLRIVPLFFRSFYYCKKCLSVVNETICPHPPSDQIHYSGTEIRDMLLRGESPPPELVRPEVAKIIRDTKNPFND